MPFALQQWPPQGGLSAQNDCAPVKCHPDPHCPVNLKDGSPPTRSQVTVCSLPAIRLLSVELNNIIKDRPSSAIVDAVSYALCSFLGPWGGQPPTPSLEGPGLTFIWGFSDGKNLREMWETRVWSLDEEDPLEKGIATHSSILAWRIPWTE